MPTFRSGALFNAVPTAPASPSRQASVSRSTCTAGLCRKRRRCLCGGTLINGLVAATKGHRTIRKSRSLPRKRKNQPKTMGNDKCVSSPVDESQARARLRGDSYFSLVRLFRAVGSNAQKLPMDLICHFPMCSIYRISAGQIVPE